MQVGTILVRPQELDNIRNQCAELELKTNLDTKGILTIYFPEDTIKYQLEWTEGFYHLTDRDFDSIIRTIELVKEGK